MEIFSKITEADGWTLAATGVGTVFFTLVFIWGFIALFSSFQVFFAKFGGAKGAAESSGEGKEPGPQGDNPEFRVLEERYLFDQDREDRIPPGFLDVLRKQNDR